MAYQKKEYTKAELDRFRNRERRIMFQSIFSSLCMLYGSQNSNVRALLFQEAKNIVIEIEKTYPLDEEEKTPEYKGKELDEEIVKTEKKLSSLKNIKDGGPGF